MPTTLPRELILIQLETRRLVGRLVFPADDPSVFEGALHGSDRGLLFSLHQVNPSTGYHALYGGKVESATSLSGAFIDLAGPPGDVRLRKIL